MSAESGFIQGASTGAQAGSVAGPWGAAIGAVIGGVAGGIGGKKAAKAKRKAYARASGILGQLKQTAAQSRDLADPFNSYRPEVARHLSDMVMGRKSFQTDPGYGFMYNEAMRGSTRQARASGMRGGSVLAALQDRGVGLANQQYSTVIDRLTGLAGATPQNAISAGTLYGDIEKARIEGQAQLALGEGYSRSQGIGAKYGMLAELSGQAGKAYDKWKQGGGSFGGLFNKGGGWTDTDHANNAAADAASPLPGRIPSTDQITLGE